MWLLPIVAIQMENTVPELSAHLLNILASFSPKPSSPPHILASSLYSYAKTYLLSAISLSNLALRLFSLIGKRTDTLTFGFVSIKLLAWHR